ncbi:hypothetical protein VCHC78A1_00733 [Vibrio cholerae HC-78A1]|nr:hypothetical protein VCHC78A1_00733 [Vibrio cholerae HC-78A1]
MLLKNIMPQDTLFSQVLTLLALVLYPRVNVLFLVDILIVQNT